MTIGDGDDVGGNDDDETTLFPPRTVGVSNYIQPDAIINPWLVQKDSSRVAACHAQR